MLFQSLYIIHFLCIKHVNNRKEGKPKLVLYHFFEYLDTNLKKFIDLHLKGQNQRPLSTSLIRSFLYQLLKGVAHSPESLDKERGILKITDLGLGRDFIVPLKSNYTHEIVTLWYRLSRLSKFDFLTFMVRRQALFPGDSEFQQLLHIFCMIYGVISCRIWLSIFLQKLDDALDRAM
ncbi:hypothetical protein UlMin_006635 [Ulmus minor]